MTEIRFQIQGSAAEPYSVLFIAARQGKSDIWVI